MSKIIFVYESNIVILNRFLNDELNYINFNYVKISLIKRI